MLPLNSLISQQYIIAKRDSERFQDLEIELSYFKSFVPNQELVYKYCANKITSDIRSEYTAPRTLHKIALANHYYYTEETMGASTLSLALNHLYCLQMAADRPANEWTLICEDDIFIPDKDNFESRFLDIFNLRPNNADIVWVSSGKKPIDASFMDITGRTPTHPINTINNCFWKINLSRYADCILIKNSAAREVHHRLLTYKIAMPIDWEYNYVLSLDSKLQSYWLNPAIIIQNPKFVDRPSH